MDDGDVPHCPLQRRGPPSASPGRFILQHFKRQEWEVTDVAPHNQDARLPADMSQFPPPVIVDMFYGCCALAQWGISQAKDAIRLSAGPLYYDGTGSGGADPAEDSEDDTEAARSRSKRARARAARHCDQSERRQSTLDEAMDLLLILWSRSAPKRQEKPPSTQEEDMRRDRVKEWLQTQ